MKKIVVSRGVGPRYNGYEYGPLTKDKSYEAISIHYQNEIGMWVDDTFTHNPSKAKFYIKVIDDNGKQHDIWNDYFYSNEELRELNLLNLLGEFNI